MKSSKQPMLLFCCSFYPLSSDLIEMISFSFSPADPPRPVLSGLSVIFSHQIFCGANIFRTGDCLVIVYGGVAWLTGCPQCPSSCPCKPQDSVQMCGDTDTGEEADTGDLVTPSLPRPSWVSVRTFKFLAVSPQLQPHTVKSEVNKHHLH